MLTPQVKSQFVTKVIENESGKFQVVFLVALVDGKISAKIVSVKNISSETCEARLSLPCQNLSCVNVEIKKSFKIVTISPYFTLDFFTSQPTRAPSK